MNRTIQDNAREDELDRALDALVAGDRSRLDTLEGDTRATIDQLFAWAAIGGLGGFDASTPPPTTASVTSGTDPWTQGTTLRRKRVPMATTTLQSPAVSVPTMRRHRPMRALWSAFAWSLTAALIGASIYGAAPFFRDNGTGDPTTTAFQPDRATPEATASAGAVNYGGDPGRSWNLGDANALTGMPSLSSIGESVQIVSQPLVVGDTIIVTIFDPSLTDDSAFQTIRHNLATGERMWTSPVPMSGPFATDDELVYGVMSSEGDDGPALGPAAIDLDTGENDMAIQLWAGHEPGVAPPIIYEDVVYFTNGTGGVAAVRKGERDLLWAIAPQPVQSSSATTSSTFPELNPRGDLVVTGEGVFVESPSMTITRLDRFTGEELGSFNVTDVLRLGVSDVSLQTVGNKLVIGAWIRTGPDEASATPMSILIYGMDSMEFFVRVDVPVVRSNLVVTPEWIYVMGQLEANGPIRLHKINPVTGELSNAVSDFAAPESASLGLSLGGDTLMAIGPTSAYAFIDVESEAVILSGQVDLESDDSLTVFPIQLWGQTPVAVSSEGAIVTFGDRQPLGP
jgi:outer membrane protein assembly factor BamB